MQYEIEDINALFKPDSRFVGTFYTHLYHFKEFIKNNFNLKIDLQFKPYVNLYITDHETFFMYRSRTYLEPICKILNIPYYPVKDGDELAYYRIRIETKIIELGSVKTVEEMQVKFPIIYDEYAKLLNDTKILLPAYNTYLHVIPRAQALDVLRKEIFSQGYDYEYFCYIVNTANTLCIERIRNEYVYDLTTLYNRLHILQNELSRVIINANTIPTLNIAKYEKAYKKTRR